MKIRYLVCMASNDYVIKPGDVRDVDAAEGTRLIEAGYAVPVVEQRETATKKSVVETRKK